MVYVDCSTCHQEPGYGPMGYILEPSTTWPGQTKRVTCPDCGGARRFVDTTGTDNLTTLVDKVIAEGGTGADVLTALDANRGDLAAFLREVGFLLGTCWIETEQASSHDGWGHAKRGETVVVENREGVRKGRLYKVQAA